MRVPPSSLSPSLSLCLSRARRRVAHASPSSSNGAVVVGVNTSPSYVAPVGHLAVDDLAPRAIIATIGLSGQPDAVDVTPPGWPFAWHVVVAVENERDEDLGDGKPLTLAATRVIDPGAAVAVTPMA